MLRVPGFQPRAPLREGEGAHVLVAVDEDVVETHEGGIVAQHLPRDGLAVEALLQVVERRHDAVAHDEQLAVEHRVERLEGGDDLREAGGDVVARAREDAHLSAPGGDLHAHAVPLPFGGYLVGIEPGPVAFLDRVRQHQRAEYGLAFRVGPRPAVIEPCEQVCVRWGNRVPHLLDVGQLMAAHLRQRRLGKTRRDADARRPADELQQRPAPAHVEAIEEIADDGRHVVSRGKLQRRDDLGEARRGAAGPPVGPQQRHGLRRVAHVVARELIKYRVDFVGHQLGERTPQRQAWEQAVGKRG